MRKREGKIGEREWVREKERMSKREREWPPL
jgi:hypothetical protein